MNTEQAYESNIHDVEIVTACSGKYLENMLEEEQRQQDLQLLIRAQQKIRELQQQNFHLKNDLEKVDDELSRQKVNSVLVEKENIQLRKINQQLLQRILNFEKELDKKESDFLVRQYKTQQYQKSDQEKHQTVHHIALESFLPSQKSTQRNVSNQNNSRRYEAKQNKTLKPSESTPVIVNINLNNGCSKQQRHKFLVSCKQQFTNELQKINRKSVSTQKNMSKTLLRNKSEYLPSSEYQLSKNINMNKSNNMFLRTAQKQFLNQNKKTIKNIDQNRAKSTSSSLIRKNNFTGDVFETKNKKSQDNGTSQIMFSDKTNLYNSKNASINQILSNVSKKHNFSRTGYGSKVPHNSLKLNSFSSHQSSIDQAFKGTSTQNKSNMIKKAHKSIYFNEFTHGTCSPTQNKYLNSFNNLNKGVQRKKKSVQLDLDLQNQNNYGVIKYRGLCL